MKSFTAALFTASLATSVVAHGWVGKLTVNGKAFKGNEPTEQTPNGAPSVVRQIANNLPVKDTTSPDITCGRSAKPAALVATAAPGDKLQFNWNTLAAGGLWFHDVGPMMTYLASCGSGSCADFDASKAKWFKIDEQGQLADGTWAQAKLDTGAPASVTLPSNLKAGNYLVRNELIALHTAQSEGNAEFYPSCSQLTVTGSGTGVPAASELVSFPGAYKPKDAGILIDIYNMRRGSYKFPGPAIASFVKGGSAPADPSADPPAETTKEPASTSTKTKGAASTSTAAPPKSTGTGKPAKSCKRRTRRAVEAIVPEAVEVEVEVAAEDRIPDVRRSRTRHLHRFGAKSF
ncbi:glycosyl hydrolase family 61-domain-containing protein [Favolaschia claudopus]|uniref:lytic cellulose monooxygenase (C4-dehydrogenating) n=1 Tax=Favolaschia claudopus TaxID=2862362 RepID=A0AAW0BYJ7_9AGAR